MVKKALISVLIPTFNYGRFIAECIGSVEQQTYRDFEIIVIDDGSTDDTKDIVARYQDVTYFYQENSGVSSARNKAIELAKGDYIAFIDADDLWMPDKLAKQIEFLQQNEGCSVVFTDVENFYDNEKTKNDPKAVSVAEREFKTGLQSALIKKAVFDRCGGFKSDLKFSEDTEWVMRIRLAGETTSRLEEPLTRRRLHGENITLRLNPLGNDCMKMLVQKLRSKNKSNMEGVK